MKRILSTYDNRFWLLCLSSFFYFFSFNLILPQLNEVISGLGGGHLKGLVIALFAASALTTRPFSGKLIEVVGRKPLIITGVIISTVVCFIYPFVGSVIGFLVLRFAHGFSAGCTPTGTTAYVADIVPVNRRGEAMGFLGMANNLGMSLGPAFGGEVALKFGNPTMFFASSAFAFITIILMLPLPETLSSTTRFKFSHLRLNLQDLFEPRVKLQSLLMVLSVASFGAVLTLIPDYCDSMGIQRRGLYFTVLTGTSLLIRFVGGKWSDIKGRAYVMTVGLVLLLIADIVLIFSNNPVLFYLSASIFGLATGLNSPTIFAWVIDNGNPKAIGRAISTLFISLELGIIIGSALPAWIYGNDYSRLPLAFASTFVMGLIALIVLIMHRLRGRNAP